MRTSQISLSIRTSQMLVRHSQKSTLLLYLPVCTSERSVHISDLSLSPSKLEDHQFALLKTSTEQFFSIALHTSDISTALFWSTTLRTHFREKLKINGINPIHYGGRRRGGGRGGSILCVPQILLFVVVVWEYQGPWESEIFREFLNLLKDFV